MIAIGLLIFGILSRLIFHIPNFTPVLALALFSGVYLKGKKAIMTPLLLMVLSDLLIGLHDTIFFTWGSVWLISVLGAKFKDFERTPTRVIFASLGAALLFFVITNFGSWLAMYPRTWQGLAQCYTAAIPFFRWTLLSTLIYSVVLFYGYEFLAVKAGQTRFARLFQSV